jgi:hypothetical protein
MRKRIKNNESAGNSIDSSDACPNDPCEDLLDGPLPAG